MTRTRTRDHQDGGNRPVADGGVESVVEAQLGAPFGFDDYVSDLIHRVSGMLLTTGLRAAQRQCGLSVNEWKVVASLAAKPGLRVTELQEALDLDKATLSRTASGLIERGLVGAVETAPRSRHLFLTDAGAAAHVEMVPVAVERQARILDGFTRDEREQLAALLRRVLANETLPHEHVASLGEPVRQASAAPS